MGKVSIILLNYNGKKFNQSCIHDILGQSYQDFEIIFVDNASTDGSLEEIKKAYHKEIQTKKIIVIESKQNTGFAGGNNMGVEHTSKDAEYICLLNNDTTLPQNRLETLVKGITSDKRLGAIGSIVYDEGFENDIKKQIFVDHKKVSASIFGEAILEDISSEEQEKGIYYTNQISGCCFLYKKHIIKKPFENYYFAYAEDIFLGFKIIISGHKLGICTTTAIHHVGSGSFGREPSDLKLFHGNKNQIVNFIVFYSLRQKTLLFPFFLIKEIGHLFLGYPGKRLKAKYNAISWIIKNYTSIKKTKREINQMNKKSGKVLIQTLGWKISDIFFMNQAKGIRLILLTISNTIFQIYGKIMKAFR